MYNYFFGVLMAKKNRHKGTKNTKSHKWLIAMGPVYLPLSMPKIPLSIVLRKILNNSKKNTCLLNPFYPNLQVMTIFA